MKLIAQNIYIGHNSSNSLPHLLYQAMAKTKQKKKKKFLSNQIHYYYYYFYNDMKITDTRQLNSKFYRVKRKWQLYH